jgi:hypothetical protein
MHPVPHRRGVAAHQRVKTAVAANQQ